MSRMFRIKTLFMTVLSMLFIVGTALAQAQPADAPGHPSGSASNSWVIPALGSFAVGIAALGAALGDGRAISAACEGTARNPGAGGRIFTMLILGLALIETLVLFTFLTVLIKG